MPVDTDLLGSCGLLLEREIFTEGDYSLSRVNYRGRNLVAEISSSDGVFQHRWPSVRGLVTPVSARDLPGGRKLLLFDTGNAFFLCEKLREIGGYQEAKALEVGSKVLKILTDLQSAGMICGYLGPEMFLLDGGDLFLLAGRRGVPVSPFTPQEVGGSRPSDPRSDVSALGSLVFRLIAGTDEREPQLKAWERLSSPIQKLIQKMVAADPVHRPGSLKKVSEAFDGLFTEESQTQSKENTPVQHTESFVRKRTGNKGGSSNRKLWYIGVPIVIVLAYLMFRFSGLPGDNPVSEPVVLPDTASFVDTFDAPSPWVEDTLTAVQPPAEQNDLQLVDTARVWVTNCTGSPDAESRYRADPLGDFSYVYMLTGTSRRRTSLITVRREDSTEQYSRSELWQTALQIAGTDTAFTVKPVDLTIMLGTDLRYAGVNAHFLPLPDGVPSDTLYVDVVNHGIQYSLEGLGAATYVGRILDGRSCTIGETVYLISVTDIRDADTFNEEIGIPESLEETIFLYHPGNTAAETLEELVRQYIQALPLQGGFPVETVPVPDLHVLLGENCRI